MKIISSEKKNAGNFYWLDTMQNIMCSIIVCWHVYTGTNGVVGVGGNKSRWFSYTLAYVIMILS